MKQRSMHRCPYCFAAIPPGNTFRVCPTRTLDDGTPCAGSFPQAVALGSKQDQEARFCGDHGVRMVDSCGAWGCQRALPERWSEVTTTAIAMAGTRSSGKTVYLAVTANLLSGWGRRRGITVTNYDNSSRINFEKRYGKLDAGAPLYGSTEPELPGRAAKHQEPVLLRLQLHGRPDHVLILRDVAGENLQDAVMDAEHFKFLANADGLILMVDPSESTRVQQALAGIIDLPAANFDPDAVWGNLESLQNSVHGVNAMQVPVAVTLSKFDLIRSAAEQPNSSLVELFAAKGSRMFHDPSMRTADFDRIDSDLLDLELRTLHSHLEHGALLSRSGYYAQRSEVRMFAVSSLGHASAVGRVASHGVIPYRCLDPVKWFLHEAGVIGTPVDAST